MSRKRKQFDMAAFLAALRTTPLRTAMQEADGTITIDWNGEEAELIAAIRAGLGKAEDGEQET